MSSLTIVVPTYRREEVLATTLRALLALDPAPDEILVIDQSPEHKPHVAAALNQMAESKRIRRVALAPPSIPAAMNLGLRLARGATVLFVDDDVLPTPDLAARHLAAHAAYPAALIAGRVIQPWESRHPFFAAEKDAEAAATTIAAVDATELKRKSLNLGSSPKAIGKRQSSPSREDRALPRGIKGGWVEEFFGGNFSVERKAALALGGFDENFAGAAYRFEAEFAHRWQAAGRRIRYAPEAFLHHLRAPVGGTRAHGERARTWRPDHAVGEYYWLLRTSAGWGALRSFAARPWREIVNREHLRAPWWIPLTLMAEMRGMAWALQLARRGPRLAKA